MDRQVGYLAVLQEGDEAQRPGRAAKLSDFKAANRKIGSLRKRRVSDRQWC
jgi:hypothetical protein